MTPADLKKARRRLGLKTQSDLARALDMRGQGGRQVRRWETGEAPIPGPVQLAIELLLKRQELGE